MKLIFIRHAEPDFAINSITEKGWREAELLSRRTREWNVTAWYSSPLGRALDTASLTMRKLGREAVVYDWLKEIDCRVQNSEAGIPTPAWDMTAGYLNRHPELFDREAWWKNADMQTSDIADQVAYVTTGLDRMLEEYGYVREGLYYRTDPDTRREAVLVCFAHFGSICAGVSHLLNLAPHVLWQGYGLAPTAVTILGSEERAEGEAYFRCQVMGDTSHLREGKEPIASGGPHDQPFQG